MYTFNFIDNKLYTFPQSYSRLIVWFLSPTHPDRTIFFIRPLNEALGALEYYYPRPRKVNMDEIMCYCSSFKLKNVIAFVQVNREGQLPYTSYQTIKANFANFPASLECFCSN